MRKVILALEDGTILQGDAFGASTEAIFELVFNTSMTGYQEILTDPSYRGRGVLFTVPHIGNVGINSEDNESLVPQISAVVLRSLSPVVSNWRATATMSDWLAQYGIPGISGVDTRFLTRKLRDGGTQKAAISTNETNPQLLLEQARGWSGLDGLDMVRDVTCSRLYEWGGDAGDRWIPNNRYQEINSQNPTISRSLNHLVAFDFGIKRNILRHLASYGARISVVSADTPVNEVLAIKPDGIFLSNGPGDLAGLPHAVETVRGLIKSSIPILGICLGHQLIGLALGASTYRLKFGHHGGNHPVQHLPSGKVLITAQNHNYCVSEGELDRAQVEITYKSLNDGSLEGFRLKQKPVLSVQFHPEAAPGPHDAHNIFSEFFALVRKGAYA